MPCVKNATEETAFNFVLNVGRPHEGMLLIHSCPVTQLRSYCLHNNAYFNSMFSFTEVICLNPEIDMVYVIDGSGSVGDSNFKTVKSFIRTLNTRFTIGTKKVRVGIQEYSSTNEYIYAVKLGEKDKNGDIDALNDVVSNMPYLNGGTYTGAALTRARTQVREYFFVAKNDKHLASGFKSLSAIVKFYEREEKFSITTLNTESVRHFSSLISQKTLINYLQ